MTQYQIICIDDDGEFLRSLKESLPDKVKPLCRDFACVFEFVRSAAELRKVLAQAAEDGVLPAMIISDQLMPDVTGLDLIEQVKGDCPNLVCILLTGHAELGSARQAINRHLLDQYVCKPIEDLQEFASLVANLLKRHHMEREERQRTAQLAATVEELRTSNERIHAMHAVAEQVAMLTKGLKCLDFGEVVELVTREVPRIFQAERGVLCFQEGLPRQCGSPATTRKRNCPASEEFLMGRADTREAARDFSVFTCDVPRPCENLSGLSPSVIIPLRLGHVGGAGEDTDAERHAYMCLCCMDETTATPRELLLYMGGLVRDVLGANLANAVLYSIARTQSETDSLTGACTRRVLEAKLDAEFQRAQRYARPFSAIVVDVDKFKLINDSYGHAVGDRVLRELADVMRSEIRSSDTLARYGGDEFVWLMPETTAAAAAGAVERLRKRLECSSAADRPQVTISCGVSEWLGVPEDTAANVLRRADAAMYRAKQSGRNRVEVSGESPAAATR